MTVLRRSLYSLLLAAAFSIANATDINSASTGLTSPASTLNFGFDDFNGVVITNQYQGSGVTFSSSGNPWSYQTHPVGAFYSGVVRGSLTSGGVLFDTIYSIEFSGPVSGAAFNFIAFTGFEWNLTAWRNDLEVGSFDFISNSGDATTRFYGFDNIEFDTLTFARTVSSQAGFGLDNLQFSLLSTTDLISNLVDTVILMNISAGISNALDAKLDSTLKALEDANTNNDIAAVNTMYAFCSSVEAQRGKKLTSAQADQLISEANGIIALLDSSYALCQ